MRGSVVWCATVWQRVRTHLASVAARMIVLYPIVSVSLSFVPDCSNYLHFVLRESQTSHTHVNTILSRVYFAPVRAVIVTAPYSAFWLNTCVVYSVDLSHRSQAIPEVSYPFTLRSRTVHSRLDSFVCVSR